MDTKIIELRMTVRALPTDNRDVQLAVKSEVLRLAELLDKQLSNPTTGAVDLAIEFTEEVDPVIQALRNLNDAIAPPNH